MAPLFGRIIPALNRAFKRKKPDVSAEKKATIKSAVAAAEARQMARNRNLLREAEKALATGKIPSHWPKDIQLMIKKERASDGNPKNSANRVKDELRKRGIEPKK